MSDDRLELREEIRAELEATRSSFHDLLNSLSDADWQKPSGNPAWTTGQLMYHMTFAPRMVPSDVRLIRRMGWTPKPPAFLFNGLNILLTRWGARKHTPQSLGGAYDAAHQVALDLLDTIQDDEWDKGMEYPGWDPLLDGYVTIERLFHYLSLHFEVHAEQVREGLNISRPE